MNSFEFFFSFYGLVLGFSVAELVGGFARVLHEGRKVKLGLLTPLLAVFLAMDLATFWNQAWVIFRNAPYNFALLNLGLLVAIVFYIAATLVFPRDFKRWKSLDDYFWLHRRTVLLCVAGANLLVITVFLANVGLTGELSALGLSWLFWAGAVVFLSLTLFAALAPGRRLVTCALIALVAYNSFQIGRAAVTLINDGGWSVTGRADPPAMRSQPSRPAS